MGRVMALTDKSAIPLGVHDLRVIEGERCFPDRRINLRLGYRRPTEVRDLIKRNHVDMEARWGTVRHRAVRIPESGQIVTEYWLTKGQALWVCRKSDAKNADDVMEEVIKVFLAVDAGAPTPDTPWTDALLAPERPIIERGDDNIVHVEWEQPLLDMELPTTEPSTRPARARHHYTDEECAKEIEEAKRRGEELAEEYGFKRPTRITEEEIDEEHADAMARHIWLGREAEAPKMLMRDELPIGCGADGWYIWVRAEENWRRLPLELRQRWWRDTDYGKRAPSQELVEAIIAVAVP